MSVTYKDYYAILGVDRGADEAAIKKAYRKKARELHPDRNKGKGAEEQFRDVNEAYEVLGDPEKRARYDRLGANWQNGAAFDPGQFGEAFGGAGGAFRPEDLESLFGNLGAAGGARGGRGAGGFSDFFEALFGGGLGGFGGRGGFEGGGFGGAGQDPFAGMARAGQDIEAEVELRLADLLAPQQKTIALGIPGPDGHVQRRSVTINIPGGLRPGQRMRLPGQGAAGHGGGAHGDIYLKVRVRPEPHLAIEGDDLVTDVDVPAPVAVVGGTVRATSPEGPVTLRVAPGTESGTTLRVRGRGLLKRDGTRGDLRARVRLTVPRHPTERERALWQQLADLDRPDDESR